jgi:hypothetical protein
VADVEAKERNPWAVAVEPIPGIFQWYRNNAVTGTVLVAAYVVLKGYVLAKGDISTALGILQYAGLTSVVIAGLLSSLPILAAAMLAYTVCRVMWTRWPRLKPAGRVWVTDWYPPVPVWRPAVVMLGAFVLSAVFTPWTYMAGAVGIGLAIGGLWGITRHERARRRRLLIDLPIRLPIGLIATGAVIAMLYTVWVPHEIVGFRPGTIKPPPPKNEVVGYVLSEDNGWITMLTSGLDKHGIIRYRDASVTSQTICERHSRGGLSDITDAFTLWDEVTEHSFLRAWHPAPNTRCPD